MGGQRAYRRQPYLLLIQVIGDQAGQDSAGGLPGSMGHEGNRGQAIGQVALTVARHCGSLHQQAICLLNDSLLRFGQRLQKHSQLCSAPSHAVRQTAQAGHLPGFAR